MPAQNVRSLLREAAQARKSTLILRGLNPTDCTPSPSKARRVSRPSLEGGTPEPDAVQLADKFAASVLQSPEGVSTRASPATSFYNVGSVEPAMRDAASESEWRERLLASQEEVQRLQCALQSEHNAARRLSAQLAEAEEARKQLENQIEDLRFKLEEQTRCASDAAAALSLQQGTITDSQLQEFADEMEEIQEKLAASEKNNAQLQSEWDDVQQELRDEIVELQGKLANSQRATQEAEDTLHSKERVMRDELDEVKRELASSDAALERAEGSRLKEVADLQSKIVALEEAGRELEAVAEQEVEELKFKLAELEASKVLAEAEFRCQTAADLARYETCCDMVPVNVNLLVQIRERNRGVSASFRRWVLQVLRSVCARIGDMKRRAHRSTSHVQVDAEQWELEDGRGVVDQDQDECRSAWSSIGVSEGVQIGGGECVSEGVQTNAGNECVSEGVQTSLVVGEAKAAQTAPTAGAGIHTQTVQSESVAAAAQTVAPEPGVVVHTQTTATTTTNMATGTADEEAEPHGVDLAQVAPGPAPAPREVSQMTRWQT